MVAVHALTDLAATQTERLQVLFTLTRMRWRVVAASDVHIAEPVTGRRLDGLADETDEDGWVTGYDGAPVARSAAVVAAADQRHRRAMGDGVAVTSGGVDRHGAGPRCSAATRLGTTMRQASSTISRISSRSMAASRTTTHW